LRFSKTYFYPPDTPAVIIIIVILIESETIVSQKPRTRKTYTVKPLNICPLFGGVRDFFEIRVKDKV